MGYRRKDLGYKINTLISAIFFFFTLAFGIVGVIGLFIISDIEIERPQGDIWGWVTVWAITGVFGFLSYVFYKKLQEHEKKTKSPEERSRERKQLLYKTLPAALAVGVVVALTNYVSEDCNDESPTILGTDKDDTLIGTTGRDVIMSKGGNDVIDGLSGDDIICGGSGDDNIKGGEGNDKIFGEEGNDIIDGGVGDDRINGGDGDDKIFGRLGNDDLFGGLGNDVLKGGDGNDDITGYKGDDTLEGENGDDDLNDMSGINILNGGEGEDECISTTNSQLIDCE